MYIFTSSKELVFSSDNIGKATRISRNIRKLQGTTSNGEISLSKTDFGFVVIDTSSQNNEGILLELNPVYIQTASSIYLGNSRYAVDSNTKSSIDVIYQETYGLYRYGRAMVFLLLFATIVFMGQQMTYKTDNIFITFGVIYLVLPTLNLTPSSSNFNSYSFLYGFAWSTYL